MVSQVITAATGVVSVLAMLETRQDCLHSKYDTKMYCSPNSIFGYRDLALFNTYLTLLHNYPLDLHF